MKKFITTIILALVAVTAFAQLNVQSQEAKLEKIGTLRSTYSFVLVKGSVYSLYIKTDNRFDDGTLFVLGDSAESAILTASDLVDASNTMDSGESINVVDCIGQKAHIWKKTMLGKPYLNIKMSDQAGTSNIGTPELEKAIEIIKKHANIS